MDAVTHICNLRIPGVNGKQRLEDHAEVYMLSGLEDTEWQKQHEILYKQGGIRELTSKNLLFDLHVYLGVFCGICVPIPHIHTYMHGDREREKICWLGF